MDKNPFEYQKPDAQHVIAISMFREICKQMADLAQEFVRNSPERSIAIRKLEEFSMWINKAIVFYESMEIPTGVSPGLNAMQKEIPVEPKTKQ